jgi:hypothetical protein
LIEIDFRAFWLPNFRLLKVYNLVFLGGFGDQIFATQKSRPKNKKYREDFNKEKFSWEKLYKLLKNYFFSLKS